ncbi:MAG: hypothetical protein LBT43_07420 [Prevotella sp.]|jgi:hypothetical protein|nr:hypothetical protein [Prevotella sp.]
MTRTEQKESGIKLHDIARDVIYTTGAYIMPFSYTNQEGKTWFAWMVTGFEADTYCDGNPIEVNDSASFLDGLTPPEDSEQRKTEYIIQSLQSSGLQRIELGLYRTILEDVPSTVYIRQLDDISYAGHITQIESTLDSYLLDSPHFSQTLREIIVDAFGCDRQDIFLTDENALIIGSCRANIWKVQENPHKYIPSEGKKPQRPDISSSLAHYSLQMQELAHKDLEEIRQHLKANGMIKDIEQYETYTAFYKDKSGNAVAAEYTSVEIVQSGEIYIGLTDGQIICEPQFTMSNIFDIFSIIQENHGTYQK